MLAHGNRSFRKQHVRLFLRPYHLQLRFLMHFCIPLENLIDNNLEQKKKKGE
jgi:hypothetical protein